MTFLPINNDDILTIVYKEYPDIWERWLEACALESEANAYINHGEIEEGNNLLKISEDKKEECLVAIKIVFADHEQLR